MRRRLSRLLLTGVLLCPTDLAAHPDLVLQINELSAKLETAPGDVALRLKRGDLYRRHGQWMMAEADFNRARSIEPGNTSVDWLMGRLLVQSGDARGGEALLSRFLNSHPGHLGALQSRARAWWRLGKPAESADDYRLVITTAERPSPVLFRALAVSLYAAGNPDQAATEIARALQRFPSDPGLLGMGIDLALERGNRDQARSGIAAVPGQLLGLPQWVFRKAVLDCLDGEHALASSAFKTLAGPGGNAGNTRAGTWNINSELIQALALQPGPALCRSAVSRSLHRHQP